MRCNDILNDTAAATFPAMEKKIQDLKQKCHHYKLNFMQKLGSVLPAIRGGGREESALLDHLNAHESSPFNSNELDQWLTNKEKESETMKSYLKQLQKLDVKMDDNLEDLLADLDVRYVVCFSFTSVDEPDNFLAKLSHYLKPSGILNKSAEFSDLQATNKDWLSTNIKQVRGQMKLFGELLKINTNADTKFIVASKYDKCFPGACIYIYEDGSDDAVHFSPPSKPATPITTGVSHDSVTVRVADPSVLVAASTPGSATVEYRVECREKQSQETEWKSQQVLKNQELVTLSGLKSQTEYEIRATAVGKLNYAVSSDVSSETTTMVSSPTLVIRTFVTLNLNGLGTPFV